MSVQTGGPEVDEFVLDPPCEAMVNGEFIVESGAVTDTRSGTVLRSGRDTDSVTTG